MTTLFRAYVFLRFGDVYRPIGLLASGDSGFFFRYGKRWLAAPEGFSIDPATLPLREEEFYSKNLFSVFRDACPDKWGRKLLAVMRGGKGGEMTDFEALTAIHSPDRFGALSFGQTPESPNSMAAWARAAASPSPAFEPMEFYRQMQEVDRGVIPNDDVFLKTFNSSFSIGGARPKAVVAHHGKYWIAKFSKADDEWDEPLIEYGTMLFAKKCGINVPELDLLKTPRGNIFLARRFDRESERAGHLISYFTLGCLKEDGYWGSYHHVAECLRRYGRPAGEEVFRRMVFNALAYNIDDHPRNHAFFVGNAGISIAPAYDLVPAFRLYTSVELALACGRNGREASVENLLSDVAPFGMTRHKAEHILTDIQRIFSDWEEHFLKIGVTGHDMEHLKKRFCRNLVEEEENDNAPAP
ncbi:MAG: type II toxin-antitoxin system HipA family toxin [Desulfovibrio sp.]|nr:type II toxin-antitoxin system HipA family toxin [Desulfovibrio sp.]